MLRGVASKFSATPAGRLLDLLAEQPDGQAALDDLQHYLDEYGHQIYNLDFVVPTQIENPLPVLLSLRALVKNPDRDARARQADMAQAREALVKSTIQALNPFSRWLFRLVLRWAQRFTPYREGILFYLGSAWPTLRRLALELGRRLTEAGLLGTADDVFYLETAELMSAINARSGGESNSELVQLAQERRILREARKRLTPPLAVPPKGRLKIGPFDLSALEPQPGPGSKGSTLTGFAVSPGRVAATASVIRSVEEFDKMTPDTILVCTTTTPAWTPLFSQAKGLVTDIGGALAHGSIVAREYGIPAVMGTGNATQRIENGQRILVDGDAGLVMLSGEMDADALRAADGRKTASRARKFALAALVVGLGVGLVVWWEKTRVALSVSNIFFLLMNYLPHGVGVRLGWCFNSFNYYPCSPSPKT